MIESDAIWSLVHFVVLLCTRLVKSTMLFMYFSCYVGCSGVRDLGTTALSTYGTDHSMFVAKLFCRCLFLCNFCAHLFSVGGSNYK